MRPIGIIASEIRHIIRNHRLLWGERFQEAWDRTPFDGKLAWIIFINNTIALITLIEILILKKR